MMRCTFEIGKIPLVPYLIDLYNGTIKHEVTNRC